MGEAGLEGAIQRLQEALSTRGASPLISLSESLFWAYAVEQWHRTRIEAEGRDYFALRSSLQYGNLFAALMYARGFVTHGLALMGTIVLTSGMPGKSQPGTLVPGGRSELRWVSKLPKQDARHRRHEHYADHIAGKPLVPVMKAAQEYLHAVGEI